MHWNTLATLTDFTFWDLNQTMPCHNVVSWSCESRKTIFIFAKLELGFPGAGATPSAKQSLIGKKYFVLHLDYKKSTDVHQQYAVGKTAWKQVMHTEMFPLLFSQDQNMERSALSTPTHLPTVTGQKATDVANAKHSKIIIQAPKLTTMALKAEFKRKIGVLFFVLRFKFLNLYNQVLCLFFISTRNRNSSLHCIFSVEAKYFTSFILSRYWSFKKKVKQH